MKERLLRFDWDKAKADANARKHGVTFEWAATVFFDPKLLTVADLEHGGPEERWLSVGAAANGTVLSIAYLWFDADPAPTWIRLISARKATRAERDQDKEAV